jgi:hypothetical protein
MPETSLFVITRSLELTGKAYCGILTKTFNEADGVTECESENSGCAYAFRHPRTFLFGERSQNYKFRAASDFTSVLGVYLRLNRLCLHFGRTLLQPIDLVSRILDFLFRN